MSDVFTKAKRSAVMARIRSTGNRDTELRLIAIFRAHGITGWRRHRVLRGPGAEDRGQTPAKFRSISGVSTQRTRRPQRKGKDAVAAGGRRQRSANSAISVLKFGNKGCGQTFAVRPDFVFPKLRLAVFVDGCFWHGCPRHFIRPRNNAAFWRKKIARNQARDRLVTRTLRQLGWKVMRIWEHELARKNEPELFQRLSAQLGWSVTR